MRAAGLLVVGLLATGCGGSLAATAGRDGRSLSAYGMSVELPAGWTGRIVLGAAGRPVLHAAAFPLSANDDDSGEIAPETLRKARAMYMSMRLPAGWDGRMRRGELDASSTEISLRLLEHATGIDGTFVTGRVPIRLSDAEFVPPGETGRSFIDHDRAFVLWVKVEALPPS